jgi:NAD+ synthase (glutamine-hydrolysing)
MAKYKISQFGFVRVAAAVPVNQIRCLEHNQQNIVSMIAEAQSSGASVIAFPHMVLTTSACGDALFCGDLIAECEEAIEYIIEQTSDLCIISVIGTPLFIEGRFYEAYVILCKGKVLGIAATDENITAHNITFLGEDVLFGSNITFSCENMMSLTLSVVAGKTFFSQKALPDANIIIVPDSSPALIGQTLYRRSIVKALSARSVSSIVYVNAGFGDSSTDYVCDGDSFICENGTILSESLRYAQGNQIIYADIDTQMIFNEHIHDDTAITANITFKMDLPVTELHRTINPSPFVPSDKTELTARCNEVMKIMCGSLLKRLQCLPTGTKCVIGVSGGLDSTLALLVIDQTLKLLNRPITDMLAVTMPGFGTTAKTRNNAVDLCKALGIPVEEHTITDISKMMLAKVDQSLYETNTVYENVQARARTYLLMTIANKIGGIVIGTGDLSEIALGWATYNGDHISMYNVNADVPKTLIKQIVYMAGEQSSDETVGHILKEIATQPISPELMPASDDKITQETESIIGPYELHDFFLYNIIRRKYSKEKTAFLAEAAFGDKYDSQTINKWLATFLRRFAQNQWKRDCSPGGPMIGTVNLCPRGGWNMPSDIIF